jgi:5-amino-6-(5-phosphoribosylamino)uracil reductase
VLLSVAVSVDGYIDDAGPRRLLLSNAADFDRVDRVRAESDAILVGAGAVRRDDPALTVKSPARQAERVAAGKPAQPLKATVSASGALDADRRLWRSGGPSVVYTVDAAVDGLRARLAPVADAGVDVVSLGAVIDFATLLDDLGARGVRRLMVEGGSAVLTGVLAADLADELQVAVAPLLVGQAGAPRLANPATFPTGRMRLADVARVDDVAVLRYLPKERGATR